MNNELGEKIAALAETVDNMIAAEAIPFPAHLAKEARTMALTDLREELRAIAVEQLGRNPWTD